ncbi:hypothetical protein G8O18_14005 [Enterobacter kobei]|uniref:hypothetical protein n=1 Tax=Enterobacter kobei TaxID=208224 RepID=UPI002F2FAA2C
MKNIFVLSAKAGAGKTTVVIEAAIKQAQYQPVVIMQETLDLLKQTEADIKAKSSIQIEKITSDECSAAQTIYNSVKDKTPRIMLITQAGFMLAMNKGADFSEFIGYWDEFMQVADVVKVKTDISSEVFTRSYTVVGIQGSHAIIQASDDLKTWAKTGSLQDYGLDGMTKAGVVDMLLADYRVNYLSADKKYITSIITPDVFKDFSSLTLIGACWEYHEQAMLWKQFKVQMSPLQTSLRFVEINGSVLLGYVADVQWSSTFMTKNQNEVSSIMNDVFKEYDHYLFCCNENVQMSGLNKYVNDPYDGIQAGARWVSPKCAGLNKFKEADAAAFLCCLNRPTEYYKQIKDIFQLSTLDVYKLEVTCHNAYYAYQFLYRTRIRLYNGESVNFVVGSKAIAEVVKEMFNCGTLFKVDTCGIITETATLNDATAAMRIHSSEQKEGAASSKELLKEKKKEVSGLIRRATQLRLDVETLDMWKSQRDIAVTANDIDALCSLQEEIKNVFHVNGWNLPA